MSANVDLKNGFNFPIPFKATDGAIPACGVFVGNGATLDDAGENYVVQGRKTQSLGERPIYVASPVGAMSNGYGDCVRPQTCGVLRVAYYTSDGTPAAGEVWGPVASSYLIRKGFPGFLCLATGDGTNVMAIYDGVEEPSYSGKLVNNLSGGGSSSTFSVYYWTGTTFSDSSLDETVYSPLTLASGSTITANKYITAKWNTAARRLIVPGAAQC